MKAKDKSSREKFWNFSQEELSLKRFLSAYLFFLTPPLSKKIFIFDPTLISNNSGLKNDSIKNHHFFRNGRTSAFIWHICIPLENFCIGVIGKNAKKYRFCPFSVSRRWKKVRGRRSDNFEATGRAHSSFGSFLPILFGEHIEIGITSETVGLRPPWSEMIQICVLKKNFPSEFSRWTIKNPFFLTGPLQEILYF